MRFIRSCFIIAAATLALGTAHGAGQKEAGDLPGFNEMDKNDDGALTRAEAAGNPELLTRFKEVDEDGDGSLTRYEYMKSLAKEEFRSLRDRVADWIDPGNQSGSSAGSGKAPR